MGWDQSLFVTTNVGLHVYDERILNSYSIIRSRGVEQSNCFSIVDGDRDDDGCGDCPADD